jgi:hypothetical protein
VRQASSSKDKIPCLHLDPSHPHQIKGAWWHLASLSTCVHQRVLYWHFQIPWLRLAGVSMVTDSGEGDVGAALSICHQLLQFCSAWCVLSIVSSEWLREGMLPPSEDGARTYSPGNCLQREPRHGDY